MIDKNKLVAKLDETLDALEVHAKLSQLALAVDPDHAPFHHQKGKSEGATQVLEAIKLAIAGGVFDVEPDTIPAPPPSDEDMDEEAPEEEPATFGVFYVTDDTRSLYVTGDFDTRSEAWAAVLDNEVNNGLPREYYEVRPL